MGVMQGVRGVADGRSKIAESRRGQKVEQEPDDNDWIGYREVYLIGDGYS